MIAGLRAEEQGTWDLIETLVNSIIINKVNTILPCEVVEINKDAPFGRCSVRALVMPPKANRPPVVYHNVPVLQARGAGYSIECPVYPGDKGLLLTCKYDISKLKQNEVFGTAGTQRTFDRNDSVFLPLVMSSSKLSDENNARLRLRHTIDNGKGTAEVTISNKGVQVLVTEGEGQGAAAAKVLVTTERVEITAHNGIKVESTGEAGVLVKGDRILLDCDKIESSVLRDAFDAVLKLLDAQAAGMTGSGTNPAQYNTQKPLVEPSLKKIQSKHSD